MVFRPFHQRTSGEMEGACQSTFTYLSNRWCFVHFSRGPKKTCYRCPPIHQYLIFEKSSSMNWIFNLQISKLIFFSDYTGSNNPVQNRVKIQIFPNLLFKNQLQMDRAGRQVASMTYRRTASHCPRTDLSKRFLPKPVTTTGWKGTP